MGDLDPLGVRVAALRPRPGDLLIVRSEEPLSEPAAQALLRRLRDLAAVVPDVTVLVLSTDVTLERLAEWPTDTLLRVQEHLSRELARRGGDGG